MISKSILAPSAKGDQATARYAFALLGSLSGLGIVGKVGLIHSLISLPYSVLIILVLLSVFLPLTSLWALRYAEWFSVLFVLILVFGSFVIYPHIAKMRALGRGSDQPDCIISAASEMAKFHWPYYASLIPTHNAMSCGPGWVLLQTPVTTIFNYPINLISLWATALGSIWWFSGRELTLRLMSLLAICPGAWMCASNGADFLPFGICLVSMFIAASVIRRPVAILVAAICLTSQFRVPTIIVTGFLGAYIGTLPAVLTGMLALGVIIIFFFIHPIEFVTQGPLHVWFKLTKVPVSPTHIYSISLSLALVTLGGLYTATRISKKVRPETAALVLLLTIFGLPALLDLVSKFQDRGFSLNTLGIWEGGIWLSGCLPLAAYLLVSDIQASTRRSTS